MTAIPAPDGRWTVRGNRWDTLPALPPRTPSVSVIVPHYEAPADLALVLAALRRQTHPASRTQVVVVDDGSRVPPDVGPNVLLLQQDDEGFRAAAARNLGVTAADGDVLCFLDGDTVPEPGYVEAAARIPALTADGLVVGRRRHADLRGMTPAALDDWFGGRSPAPPELDEPAWLTDAYRDSHDLLDVDDRSYRHVISAVLTCARDLFDAVGGFDGSFTRYGGEDWEFAHRAFTGGAVFAHVPDAVAWHDGGDWAARSPDAAAAGRQKADETARLAPLVPDPHLRGAGPWELPAVAAWVRGGTATERAACARTLRDAADDLGVWIDDAGHDPVPPRVRRHARVRLDVTRPVRFDRDRLTALLDRVAAPGPGRIATADGAVTVTSSRAWFRAARHGVDVADLFGAETVAPFPP